jgi:hypothetical protein
MVFTTPVFITGPNLTHELQTNLTADWLLLSGYTIDT